MGGNISQWEELTQHAGNPRHVEESSNPVQTKNHIRVGFRKEKSVHIATLVPSGFFLAQQVPFDWREARVLTYMSSLWG